jgi:hypothetical protein
MFLWLAAHKRCWTADRLAKRGLPHPDKCRLCDQEKENINHLLVSCVFTRQFWYLMLRQIGLHSFAPQPTDLNFDSWWRRIDAVTTGLNKKGLNSLVILGAWIIWNHRNRCVFDGDSPNLTKALILADEERRMWIIAGARGLSYLMPPPSQEVRSVC